MGIVLSSLAVSTSVLTRDSTSAMEQLASYDCILNNWFILDLVPIHGRDICSLDDDGCS